MDLQPSHLAALVAIADHGTFEAAAPHPPPHPAAGGPRAPARGVSQRIRALESEVGQVVVRRAAPCRPTPAGEELLRVARQTRLLHDELREALGEPGRWRTGLPVAVNADSLATWFRGVLGEVAGWPDT